MVQRSSTTAFAKSTRPEIGGVIQRQALYTRLDATPARTIAWIHAPPGFGKTTLAASYLEARSYRWAWYQVDADDDDGESFFHYLTHAVRHLRDAEEALPVFAGQTADLAAFARRYFRSMFKGRPEPTAIVLDNLHELSSDSPLHRILEAGLPEIPRQCCVIVTSRASPPGALSRLLPSGQMVTLTADDLRIDDAELAEMAQLRGSRLPADLLRQVRERTEGWAAALVLMIEHDKLSASPVQMPLDTTPKVVFDYLAGEIFDRFDTATKQLLLSIACVPRVTIDVAQGLSGETAAARILFNLAHNDYFVRELVGPEGRVFVLHPLLREFLLRRAARDVPGAVAADALRRAARLLRDAGQFEDAMTLFVECADWPEAAAVAAGHVDALLAQGRTSLLVAWLELLPPHVLAAHPELQFAQGAALAHISPRAARRSVEEAFEAFERRNDRTGMARCCVAAIDVLLREFDDLDALDRWLVEFDRCRTLTTGSATLAPVQVAVARLWRDPSHASIAGGAELRQADVTAPSRLVLATAAALKADFAGASAMLRSTEGQALDAPAVNRAAVVALCRLLDGDAAAALAAAREGLAHGETLSAHGHDAWLHMLCAASAIGLDDLDAARQALALAEPAATRRGDRAFLHVLLATLANASGQAGLALREAKSAALLAVESGNVWAEALARLAMAQLLFAADDRQSGDGQLRAAEALAERTGSPLLRVATLFVQADRAVLLDAEDVHLPRLHQALGLARELGVHHVPGLLTGVLGRLCAVALRRGIAPEHARLLIAGARLSAPADALRLREWPWAFEVTTLGSFGLLRAGEPIEFSAKGPGRPVELLKLLVSLGGQQVRVDQLADTLWPHVDADYAHQSFTATLHRLRRILGGEDTLKLRDGRLSLNATLFWIDVWALDEVLSAADISLRDAEPSSAGASTGAGIQPWLDEVLSLYRGPFLADETEHPSYAARREQLRAKLLRTLTRVTRQLEASGRTESAIDAYLRFIEVDEQCEAFHRHLMLCHQRQGEIAEAVAIYDRLRTVLAARSQGEPSPETLAIRLRLTT